MYQPTTSDIRHESAQPERETVIKFVISGPFLNAESAHTQWAAEPAVPTEMNDLLRRLAELERKLEDERARVEELCHQLAAVPPPAPVATPVSLPAEPPRLVEPPKLVEPEAPSIAPVVAEPQAPSIAAVVAEPEAASIAPVVAEPEATNAAPAPPRLSTVARTPPPKVRGLRRMIGALRHL